MKIEKEKKVFEVTYECSRGKGRDIIFAESLKQADTIASRKGRRVLTLKEIPVW